MEGPQQSRANKLLSMSKYSLLLDLHGDLHKIGKDLNPLCRRCLNSNETVDHLCESLIISQVAFFDNVKALFTILRLY